MFAAGLTLTCASLPVGAAPLPKVASANLCADQYLMAIADPTQVVSLSWQSKSEVSYYREAARDFPQNRGTTEELLLSEAEVIVVSDFGDAKLLERLQEFEVKVVKVPTDAAGLDEIASALMGLAVMIGREEAGAMFLADTQARLADVRKGQREISAQTPRIIYLRAGGGGAATGTYIDHALTLAGFVNLQSEMGASGWAAVTLEALVDRPPDAFLVSPFEAGQMTLDASFSRHRKFVELAESRPVIEVPAQYWPCSSPHLIDAIEAIARARQMYFPDRRKRGEP